MEGRGKEGMEGQGEKGEGLGEEEKGRKLRSG